MPTDPLDTLPRVDLRIPGPWETQDAFRQAVARKAKGYAFEGEHLVHPATGRRFSWGASEHDDELADLFAANGRTAKGDVKRVASHAVKIHLSGPGGSVDAVHDLMRAGAALVRAGAYGVMVDNSGAAHAPSDWTKLAEGDDAVGGCYWGCVIVTVPRSGGLAFTVGMHCMGLRDAEVEFPPGVDRKGVAFLLHNFHGYALQSGAVFVDGDPIGDERGPQFRLRATPCTHPARIAVPQPVRRLAAGAGAGRPPRRRRRRGVALGGKRAMGSAPGLN